MSMRDDPIKAKLPRTWFPFFSRFGKLQEVQRQCIPQVLEGTNLVVCSPTATGKTEAILAPLVERLLAQNWVGLSILWVSPTRALVNDLYARFKYPLESLGVTFTRRTGDRPEFNPQKPTSVLVTTPESFDSLLSRYPSAFEGVKTLVLDDIHLLDGTYRGDQLRVLLKRLRLINPGPINFYALSATIGDPVTLGKRYLSDFRVVNLPIKKRFDFYLLPAGDDVAERLLEEFRSKGIRKILAFTNSRHEAEQLTPQFKRPPFAHQTFVHHGSMSKGEREGIERFMNSSPVGICIATTTLELGIDIGDIDAVVLFGPPHNVRSLLQRVGRGNRRREDYALAYGVFEGEWEKLLFQVLFEDARDGRLGEELYAPFPSVGVQQIFSYLYQRRKVGATLGSFQRVLSDIIAKEKIFAILDYLSEKEYVKTIGEGIFGPSERLLKRAERGWIHSNIDRKPGEYTVINVDSGREIGHIQLLSPQFRLGGKFWNTIKLEKDKAWVRPTKGVFQDAGKVFKGKNVYWDYRLGLRLKQRLFPGLAAFEFPYRKDDHNHLILHFCGPVYGYIWQEALKEKGVEAEDLDGKYMVVQGLSELDRILPEGELLLHVIEQHAGVFKKFFSLGSFLPLLPPQLQLEAVVQAFKLKDFTSFLHKMVFKAISGIELGAAMERLGE